jgi:hypothetical protein
MRRAVRYDFAATAELRDLGSPNGLVSTTRNLSVLLVWYLEDMDTQEKQSPTTLIYRSGTSQALGPDWDVLEVSRKRKDHGVISTNSVFIARNVGGTIIRKIDSSPERWALVRDEETLRACQGRFDHRDKLAGEEAAGAGRKVEEE